MDFLPVFLDVRQQRCVVIGGGAIAARKVALLHAAGARVVVIAPIAGSEIMELAAADTLELVVRGFQAGDVVGARLVVAATDDAAVNHAAAAASTAAGVLVNVVDSPALCSAIMPSIVDRSPVIIAVGTGGNAPVLARLLRAKLESMIPQAYGELAALLGALRERVRAALPDTRLRRRFWEKVIEGPAAELLFAGRRAQAERLIEDFLARPASAAASHGEVYLIGAGPGDPDLLTFRALRLMQHADVVVYDRLVGDDIVALCRRDAERIFVGKASRAHTVSQDGINELLVQLARSGKRVARLKGGDPFVFGRGGEEVEFLATAGVSFQIVPGITAALGCAAYAGIPLTHRDLAHSCLFVTGHQQNGVLALDWEQLVRPRQTVVVYMGVGALPALCAGLRRQGLEPTTPAALIERGTTRSQRVITGTVASLPDLAARTSVSSPALIIVGDVVALAERLQWFEPVSPAGSA